MIKSLCDPFFCFSAARCAKAFRDRLSSAAEPAIQGPGTSSARHFICRPFGPSLISILFRRWHCAQDSSSTPLWDRVAKMALTMALLPGVASGLLTRMVFGPVSFQTKYTPLDGSLKSRVWLERSVGSKISIFSRTVAESRTSRSGNKLGQVLARKTVSGSGANSLVPIPLSQPLYERRSGGDDKGMGTREFGRRTAVGAKLCCRAHPLSSAEICANLRATSPLPNCCGGSASIQLGRMEGRISMR